MSAVRLALVEARRSARDGLFRPHVIASTRASVSSTDAVVASENDSRERGERGEGDAFLATTLRTHAHALNPEERPVALVLYRRPFQAAHDVQYSWNLPSLLWPDSIQAFPGSPIKRHLRTAPTDTRRSEAPVHQMFMHFNPKMPSQRARNPPGGMAIRQARYISQGIACIARTHHALCCHASWPFAHLQASGPWS